MAQLATLTNAQVILLATLYASESDLARLQILAAERKDVLQEALIYRLLLTFLPADIENQSVLVTFLQHLALDFENVSSLDATLNLSQISNIKSEEVEQRIQELRLRRLSEVQDEQQDSLTNFIISWIHKVEATAGLTPSVVLLIETLANERPGLRRWRDTYLIPLLQLQNEFYPGQADHLNLHSVESMQGISGVATLLQFSKGVGHTAEVGRDINQVVAPWVRGTGSQKRRKLNSSPGLHVQTSWRDIDDWIFSLSKTDFGLAAKAVNEWNGPSEDDHEYATSKPTSEDDSLTHYAQTILALIITSPDGDASNNIILNGLLQKAMSIALRCQAAGSHRQTTDLSKVTRADLLENKLRDPDNPITFPSDESFGLLTECIDTRTTLLAFKISASTLSILDSALFGSEDKQKQELDHIIAQISQNAGSSINWKQIRTQLQTLRRGISSGEAYHMLGRVPEPYFEARLIDMMLSSGQYQNVHDIYLSPAEPLLSTELVRDQIVSAIFDAYDNSSNGNRTRGGVKRAFDMLKAFQPKYPQAEIFQSIDHLIKATHSLSFYQLTLEHGVPFLPVKIRVQNKPLTLIERVLEQNSKAYTKLDDLIDIGRNLVMSRYTNTESSEILSIPIQERIFDAEHRVTYLAITSALSNHDFDTAYSYITTRLSTSPTQALTSPFTDDTSWRAAYAAGKYRPASTSTSIHDRISSLSKRMDLLSIAITLAPTPEPLSEILATWRRSEEEMDNLKTQAIEEERSLDSKTNFRNSSSDVLPGGFAPEGRDLDAAETKRMRERRAIAGHGPTYEEEAPMGLFDVAKGAASAFRNSAFPLGRVTAQQESFKVRGGPDAAGAGLESPNDTEFGVGDDGQQRRRKRDVVSGIVTGGLVSGMSWVLGAQPAPKTDHNENG